MNIVEQNWDLILNKMKLEYCSSNISYTTWIAPLTVYEGQYRLYSRPTKGKP